MTVRRAASTLMGVRLGVGTLLEAQQEVEQVDALGQLLQREGVLMTGLQVEEAEAGDAKDGEKLIPERLGLRLLARISIQHNAMPTALCKP